MLKKNINLLGLILIGISALPILIYPFVMLANIMSLAGYRNPDSTFMELFPARFFIFITTIYPITVIGSFYFFKKKQKILITSLPYIHIILILIAFKIWSNN